MINTILILLIFHYIGCLIFKTKQTTLNCGLFGWAGKNPKHFSLDKFNILGIFNDSRGGHSCGITIDGEIYNGIDKNKKYIDFIANMDISAPLENPVVFGHTRFATGGSHNLENAHPFGFGDNLNRGGFEFIGIHNGSLLNHKDFAPEYEVSLTEDRKVNNVTSVRTKIDSELLLESIYQSKNFKVLSDYNGAAALIFTNTNEPNVIYCYHGASKLESNDTDGKIFEERPLFYYRKGVNDLYISSIPESLEVIGGVLNETVFEFDHNVVYKIKDGNIDKAEKFKIRRFDNYQKESKYQFKNVTPRHTYSHVSNYLTKKERKELSKARKISNIYDDKVDFSDLNGKVYMEKLRYRRNGHNVTGIYVYIPEYGFYSLAEKVKDAENIFWTKLGQVFNPLTGDFSNDYSNDNKIADIQFVPFKYSIVNPPLIYIFEGCMLQTELDYTTSVYKKATNEKITIADLSWMSKHPVIDDSFTWRSHQDICKDNKYYTGNISPLGSHKIYNISGGKLESICYLEDLTKDDVTEDKVDEVINTETGVIPLDAGINLNQSNINFAEYEEVTDEITEQIDKPENFIEMLKNEVKDLRKVEEDLSEDEAIDNCILTDKLEKIFTPILINLQTGKRDLQKFLPMKRAEQGIEIIDTFVEFTEELVIKEEK